MLSEVQRANWLKEAICPSCGNYNSKGIKQLIQLDGDGPAWCAVCGTDIPVILPPRKVSDA